jgi:histidinol-phosphatase (PHP family)
MYDYHVHSNYSDGRFIDRMVGAASDAGLDGVGIADHCVVTGREHLRRHRQRYGFNLDVTYERRRATIRELREEFPIRVFDAAEVDYHPDDEDRIRSFLDEAEFDYVVGSVHELRETNVHMDYFADLTESDRQSVVDDYFERVVALVESDLFDVLAHPDIVERNPALRGYATDRHYREVARALADSRTVPEVNAGRIDREYGEFHPMPAFLSTLAEHDVPVTPGSDAHVSGQLRERVPLLREKLAAAPVDVVDVGVG